MVNFPSLPLPSLKCVCTALLPVCGPVLPDDAISHIKSNSPGNLLSIMMGRINGLATQQQNSPHTGLWPVEYEVLAHCVACVGTIGVTVCQPDANDKAIEAQQRRANADRRERRFGEPGGIEQPKISLQYAHRSQNACETLLRLAKQTPLTPLAMTLHSMSAQAIFNLVRILPESYLLANLNEFMAYCIKNMGELSSPSPQARAQVAHAVSVRRKGGKADKAGGKADKAGGKADKAGAADKAGGNFDEG